MSLRAESLLDGLAHALLHDVDVVVVQPQVAHAVLDQPAPEVHYRVTQQV